MKSQFPQLIERIVECSREKHEQDLPPTPDAVDKENFTMSEILPHIFVGRLYSSFMTSLSNSSSYLSEDAKRNSLSLSSI